MSKLLTVQTGVVRLNVRALDLAILDDKDVALAARATEDGGTVEVQLERFGEGAVWVAEEADLG